MRCHYRCNEKFNQISSKRNSTTSVLVSAKAPRHQDVLESPQGRLFKSEVLCSLKSHCSQMACKECSNIGVFALLSFPPLSSLQSMCQAWSAVLGVPSTLFCALAHPRSLVSKCSEDLDPSTLQAGYLRICQITQ